MDSHLVTSPFNPLPVNLEMLHERYQKHRGKLEGVAPANNATCETEAVGSQV